MSTCCVVHTWTHGIYNALDLSLFLLHYLQSALLTIFSDLPSSMPSFFYEATSDTTHIIIRP